jgi:hypothetical protein
MNNGWIMEELQTADLRDKRLETRLVKLLDTLSQNSTASIPAACTDRAEMAAAYRFFDNEKIEYVFERGSVIFRFARNGVNASSNDNQGEDCEVNVQDDKHVFSVVRRITEKITEPTIQRISPKG